MAAVLGGLVLLIPTSGHAAVVRITGLSNVSIGSVANLEADVVAAQSVCAYVSGRNSRYSVRASGSGSGGAFTLTGGGEQLDYEVQWSPAAGQSSGTVLTSGVTRGGFASVATNQDCGNGPSASASLIVILRAAELSRATAGSYSGTLTITVAPE